MLAALRHPSTLPNIQLLSQHTPACRYGNVYGYMPASVARDISIVLMVAHQVIVFGLVSIPWNIYSLCWW